MKQRPVTEGMTNEELREFNKMAREERRGNPSNAWDITPGFGASYKIEDKPMSDDLRYGSFDRDEYKRLKEEQEVLDARPDKKQQIEKWRGYIETLKNRIQ